MDIELKLQYMYSGGCMGTGWIDINPEQQEKYISRAMSFSKLNCEQVMELLEAGKKVHYDVEWDAEIRSATHYEAMMERLRAAQPNVEMVKCDCGHTVPKRQVMMAVGTSCLDCYDRMDGAE